MTRTPAEIISTGTRTRLAHAHQYLSAGILLHIITVAKLLVLLIMATVIEAPGIKNTVLTILGLLAIFTQLDARSRFQEYKKVRDHLVRFGPDRRIFQSLSHSRCQRDAALAAAGKLGHAAVCRNHFTAAGYRWYHLLPDFVSHHPRFLFSLAFIQATFFAPTYHARYADGLSKPINTGAVWPRRAPAIDPDPA